MNELMAGYQELSGKIRERFAGILEVIDGGRVPSKDEMDSVEAMIGSLHEKYDAVYEMTASAVDAEELPEKGLPVAAYAEAVEKSRIRKLKQRIADARLSLGRFLKVSSPIEAYSEALIPFQKEAAELEEKLGAVGIEEAEPLLFEAAIPELFLHALDVDFHNSGSVELLEKISGHYPKRIQWGLVGKNYSEQGWQEPKQELEADKKAETEDEEPGEAVLTAVNRIKISAPSATSFKKEIVRIAKSAQMVRIVLPMLTNLGVLTKEQAYRFGVGMDCFREEERSRKDVEEAFDVLASKGFVAHYQYHDGVSVVDAYCLTGYCYGCMQKNSIASLRMFWGITFGDYKFCGGVQMDKSIVAGAIGKNAVLLEYFYGIKARLSEAEYQVVKESIHWLGGCYEVAVFYEGKSYLCRILGHGEEASVPEDENILLIPGQTDYQADFGAGCGRIFAFKDGEVCLWSPGVDGSVPQERPVDAKEPEGYAGEDSANEPAC